MFRMEKTMCELPRVLQKQGFDLQFSFVMLMLCSRPLKADYCEMQ